MQRIHTENPTPRNDAQWLGNCAMLATLLALLLPPLALPAHYHQFADQQTRWGIAHALDVLTNAAFAVGGAVLLWQVRRAAGALLPAQRYALRALGAGLLATAVGSALYHLQPHDAGLALDRVGMVYAFAGACAVLVADRMPHISPRTVLWTAAALGLAAVACAWLLRNMTPWAVFQAGNMVLIALVLWRTRHDVAVWHVRWGAVLCWYAAAKVSEMLDHPLWHATGGLFSGHNAKHVLAACAVLPVCVALHRLMRRTHRADSPPMQAVAQACCTRNCTQHLARARARQR